jgi:hypothetical protein
MLIDGFGEARIERARVDSSRPEVIRSYNARKVRFSATVGGEAEVEVALV